MYDYKLLEAVASVIKKGSFDRAARDLHISQSAISQRIRQLEEQLGRPIIVRKNPPEPTELGRHLLAHFMKVRMLERELQDQIDPSGPQTATHLSLAINRDSLTLWFVEAMGQFIKDENIVLEVLAEDQELTHEYLKDGRVFGCVSSRKSALQGCRVEHLGTMSFYLCATPEFASRWFSKGVGKKSLLKAPGVIFDEKDHMLHDFLEKKFKITMDSPPLHVIPALGEYERFITDGFAYGLLAKSQVEEGFASGELINLAPDKNFLMDLYWHSWQLSSEIGETFTKTLLREARPLIR